MRERDFWRMGEINERLALALFHEAMQARTRGRFEHKMHQVTTNYSKATELYGKAANCGKEARVHRCNAMMAYAGFWVFPEASEKRMLIQECWELTKQALNACEKEGNGLEYGKTFNQLSSSAHLGCVLEWNFKIRQKITSEALECGEQAIALLSPSGESDELAKAYATTAHHLSVFGDQFVPDSDEKETYFQKALAYWNKAQELSEGNAPLQLASLPASLMPWNMDVYIENFQKASVYAKETRDRLLIGNALGQLAASLYWKSFTIEDHHQSAKMAKKALQYAEHSRRQYSSICFVSPRCGILWTSEPYSEYFWDMAERETDSKKKRQYLEKAIVHGIQGVKVAENAGYPQIIMFAHLQLSKAFVSLAQIETNLAEKKRLLEEASSHSKRSVSVSEQVIPFDYWNRGVMVIEFANLRAELSLVERDCKSKREILEEAISVKEQGLQLCVEGSSHFERTKDLFIFVALGQTQYSQAKLLSRLYELTHEGQHLKRAVNAFQEAAVSFQKPDLPSRAAECYWKIASCHDTLDEHLKAAEAFILASNSYRKAAKKIPQLKGFYEDYALYMKAWSEIERAKHRHRREEYAVAKKHFERAAEMHKSLEHWDFLASNYEAWANVELAEELSRNESSEQASEAFDRAARLFIESESSIKTNLGKIISQDEKQMAIDIVKATDLRHDYCKARIAVEEAKILERKGDHYSSSEKYGLAAETFEKIAVTLVSEEDQKEARYAAILARAWQRMVEAEESVSPAFFGEAGRLFEEASECARTETTRLLVLGHSRFCSALEAGARFTDTRDTTAYYEAVRFLQSATSHYQRAGLRNEAEVARATGFLFEAYVHMDNAKKETRPEVKARLYSMAETVLQTSAGCYTRAKRPEKREQVLSLMEGIKEEHELALSLMEILQAPAVVSTATFSAPKPTSEQAVGLERFEHPDIQAHLIAPEEAMVGEQLSVRLDAVNVGRNFGLLVRVADFVPRGARVKVLDPRVAVEDGSLDMKGKRLEPLKVESIRLCVLPNEPGILELNPELVFTDDRGEFRTCVPKPVRIRINSKLKFEFKNMATEKVLTYLTHAFKNDYLLRKVPSDKSGWRTLMEIVKEGKVPKWSVYGAGRRTGSAVSELQRLRLAEPRVFQGERGRGGRILKVRICYESETVKRYVDHQMMMGLEEPVLGIFHFLANSFVEDYGKQKLSSENCGWRTLVEVIRQGKATKSSLYGDKGGQRPLISKLERTGLVEVRKFSGERGRGGRVLKMRVCYENEVVKRYIDSQMIKS
jgi:tetratricopeptide (TPR) repeat protein